MSIVASDNFNADTHTGGMTGWTLAPSGGTSTYSIADSWGRAYTSCAGCGASPGQATKLLSPVITTAEGSIRCRLSSYLVSPPISGTDGALIASVQNYAAISILDDGYQTLLYLKADGTFRIRYKTGALTTAFQNTASGLFPVDGTWWGLQMRFTIGATNTVIFTVNNVDVATLTWAHSYVDTHWDNIWIYAVGTYTGGGLPLTSMVLLDDYEADSSHAAVTWGAGSGPAFDRTRTCFLSPIPPTPTPTTYPIRRLRRFMLPWDDANRVKFLSRLEIILQAGIGTAEISNPTVMLRLSKDGGKTWGHEIQMHAGELGAYSSRVYTNILGRGRNWVAEVTVSDPVDWQMLQCLVDYTEGLS